VGGCAWLGDIFTGTDEAPLRGTRLSVLRLEEAIVVDPELARLDIRLPAPYRNPDWTQAGGHPTHAMHHLALADQIATRWSESIGAGANRDRKVTATPVVGGGIVFTMDAAGTVSAFRASDGNRIWRIDVVPAREERGAIGGGVSLDAGVLYVATGYGDVLAVRADNGATLWSRRLGAPLRGSPTIAGGRAFVLTQHNELFALNADTGYIVWTHAGIQETAGLVNGASPAVVAGLVLAPYSSGELVALRADNGRETWADALTRSSRLVALADISDIAGLPVADRGRAFAISHAGTFAAVDLITGQRLWEQDLAGTQTPWVAGEYIYLVTTSAEVVALERDGGIHWVRALARYGDAARRRDPIQWYGPVLAGDRLLLGSSQGQVVALSPYTGNVLGSFRVSGGVAVPPVVADGTLYIVTDNATIYALR
jgi:outer membrane protein assembly factor BamB